LFKARYYRKLLFILAAIAISTANITTAAAYYGWEPTDDPVPFYYQNAGKWYYTGDRQTFMVQLNDRTYKYIFDDKGNFLDGFVTDMPVRI